MFGLTNSVIARVLEGLEGVERCTNYIATKKRKKSRIPQVDGESEDFSDFESSSPAPALPSDFSEEEEGEPAKMVPVTRTVKRAVMGKDTFLRVRCRRCEDGLEAEDSLM
mgnify:CR=1 FL=1